MLYVDYHWNLSSTSIVPDPDIDTNKLKWQAGDYWQMTEHNGQLQLQKVDPMIQFLLEGHSRGCS